MQGMNRASLIGGKNSAGLRALQGGSAADVGVGEQVIQDTLVMRATATWKWTKHSCDGGGGGGGII